MRTIRISDEVWNEIAKNGKFGETPDDVLRRMLKIDHEARAPESAIVRKRVATKRLSAKVEEGKLRVRFDGGPNREWTLPSKSDKSALRKTTYDAMEFAGHNGATDGQILAVRKALTDAGYHLTK